MLETGLHLLTARTKTTSFLPEDLQNELLRLRDTFKKGYFELGDIAAACVNALYGLNVTHQQVFDEIGRFVGKSGRTIRYYYETAVFYPAETREKYDALPFSHFVFARGFPDWEAVLDFAQERPYDTEDQLRRAFLAIPVCVTAGVHESAPAEWQGLQPVDQALGQVYHVTRYAYMDAISKLRESVSVFKRVMAEDDLPNEDYEFLDHLAGEIESHLQALIRLVDKLK